jgi:hypothetical protein
MYHDDTSPAMEVPFDRPLDPRRATEFIRKKAFASDLTVRWTKHATMQMQARELIMGDVLHVLKNGFVFEQGLPATQAGCYKYKMECTTPNSGGRTVKVVVIPSTANAVKIITVMWRDEDKSSGP